jgi:transposase InsO family protein
VVRWECWCLDGLDASAGGGRLADGGDCDSAHDLPIFPNLAKDMVPDGPNQLWVTEITYVAITGGCVDVAIILDAWSRRVVGNAIGRSIDVRLQGRTPRHGSNLHQNCMRANFACRLSTELCDFKRPTLF